MTCHPEPVRLEPRRDRLRLSLDYQAVADRPGERLTMTRRPVRLRVATVAGAFVVVWMMTPQSTASTTGRPQPQAAALSTSPNPEPTDPAGPKPLGGPNAPMAEGGAAASPNPASDASDLIAAYADSHPSWKFTANKYSDDGTRITVEAKTDLPGDLLALLSDKDLTKYVSFSRAALSPSEFHTYAAAIRLATSGRANDVSMISINPDSTGLNVSFRRTPTADDLSSLPELPVPIHVDPPDNVVLTSRKATLLHD